MDKFLGHEPKNGTFQDLLDGQAIDLSQEQDSSVLCPVCQKVFQRRCLLKEVSVDVAVTKGERTLTLISRFLVCTSLAAQVEQDCGFVVPVSFASNEFTALGRERIKYLSEERQRQQHAEG